ncbi:MAG: hypothetical protein J1F35_05930 [Erysipelotrichales bacterium]|nr:hypothetical protein [Erysipelotrichales bacterium]
MNLKKYTLTKGFYSEKKDVDFYLPEGLAFARTYPSSMHYDDQIDMLSILECSEEDEELIYDKNHHISTYRLGKYIIITINSVNDSKDIPECSLEELNNKYDLTEYFILEFDNEYNLLYIAKVKGLINSKNIFVDNIDVKAIFFNEYLRNININTSMSIDRLYSNTFSDHRKMKILNSNKAKIIFYTLISRYLKETGIEWRNEFVDDNLDIDYIKKTYDKFETIKIGELIDKDDINNIVEVIEKDIRVFDDINKWLNE